MTNKLSAIYTAVVYKAPVVVVQQKDDDGRHLIVPLLANKEVDQQQRSPSSIYRGRYFTAGALLGIFFSILGSMLHQSFPVDEYMLLFALSWSCLTSLSAYLLFYAWTADYEEVNAKKTHKEDEHLHIQEFYYAIGVFLGFCLACTVTDIVIGMPLSSVGLTILVAIAWSFVMLKCAKQQQTSQPTTTELPFVIV